MAIACIIALVVFAVMGIFSAKYRAYAKEAFHCFFNTIRLRKCDSGLDEKIRAEVVSRLLPISAPAAKTVNKHFELLSTIFALLMLVSSVYSAIGLYNFWAFGNCNGQQGGACLLSDIASGVVINPNLRPTNNIGQSFGAANYKVVVYEFGCYSCSYTAEEESVVQRLYQEYGDQVQFIYKPYPIPSHAYSFESAYSSWCAYEQGSQIYIPYREALFNKQAEWQQEGNATLLSIAKSIDGVNYEEFENCFYSGKYVNDTMEVVNEGHGLGVYATPVFFIGDRHFIGITSYEELKNAIEEELKK
ncbi:DsbA family protein [Candidatus Micrarchaeota archaeon]|nr:DsbA family protein [Candidatus Micrarchaeota archaeon]